MTRLIDVDALKIVKFIALRNDYAKGWNDAVEAIVKNAPTVDAVPISFIEKKIDSIRQYLEKHGGEIDIEEFVDGLISKAVAYEKLIEEWREENETD